MKAQFGPYTPQELDSILNWLDPLRLEGKLEFSVHKDEQVEKQFQKNTPENMIAYTEIRTSVYLAQMFYVEVDFFQESLREEFFKKFVLKHESLPKRLAKSAISNVIELDSMKTNNTSHQTRKMIVGVLLLIWMIVIIYSYILGKNS